ncbi:MAG TPA: hypothetical protein PLH19_05050 [Anaerolineae bacterium]|mgnify:CR=1 FL=1|nr:hypothetical protein [Anaerolineae bacterium]HQH37888.1 hypothetical protein [Anaerolineae bacterium]
MPSKLGIHGILPGETLKVLRSLLAAGATMTTVKSVEGIGWLKDVKALDARVQTVGRYMRGADPTINVEGPPLDGDLRKTARQMMDSLLPKWAIHRTYVDYWELINEQDPAGAEGHRRLAELMIHCMEIAEQEGYKLALFSYSMGVPEWEEMEAIVATGVFARAKAGGHALSLHEYAYPLNVWFGEPLPGRPTYPDRGPLACRYRWLYEDFLKPRNEVIPLFLTEVNLAKDLPRVSVEEWMQQITWYDARIREDYYVVGAHLFSLGGAGGWDNYDFTRMLPEMTKYMISIKDTQDPTWEDADVVAPGEPPVIPEPVEPIPPQLISPCQPREPFSRHYLLLPPGTDWSWMEACRLYWETFNVTIGASADDAAYGPGLSERVVTAVNPALWGDDLCAFFAAYYPGVTYDPITAETPQELESILRQRVERGQRFGSP